MSKVDWNDLILQVEKPARYMGGEWNQVAKDHATVDVTMALAFPDIYEIGMSHMGVRILYSLLNRRPDVAFERCFTPWVDLIAKMRAERIPLSSLETRTPLKDFDIVGFSLQYEMSFTNVLLMLDLAGIPLRSEQRDLNVPLVIAGGPVALSPEPLADFIDCFLIGDGEELLPTFIDKVKAWKRSNGRAAERRFGSDQGFYAKEDLLCELAQLPGVYVPSLYDVRTHPLHGLQVAVPRVFGANVSLPANSERAFYEASRGDSARSDGRRVPPYPIVRQFVSDLSKYPFPTGVVVPYHEIVHDRVSVEIARGCLDGCRFCQAGYTYRPLRERSIDDIVSTIVKSSEETGFDEATIASLSTADYSCLNPLMERLMDELEKQKIALSLTSMRADSITPELAEQIKRVRKTGFTIAPEAGTQRMRDIINKNITEESTLRSAEAAFNAGWDLIKLYFMIGLPMETEDDVRGIAELGKKVKAMSAKAKRSVNINLSASSFIPKPHTPFQWFQFADLDEIKEKQNLLKSLLRPARINFKHHHPETSQLECVLSRGDRRVGRVIAAAYRKGCIFDGWDDQFRYDVWMHTFEEEGVDYRKYLKALPVVDVLEWRQSAEAERKDCTAYLRALSAVKIKPQECALEFTPLPWDHLNTWVDKKFLVWDLKRSLQARVSPTCGPEICYHCGLECEFDGPGNGRLERLEQGKQPVVEQKPATPALREADATAEAKPVTGVTRRYRASFTKLGRAKLLSHLDLMRLLQRAFRRAGIRVKYSQGFHPQPVIAFGPALAVGIESEFELIDFETPELLNEKEFLSRLNTVLPDGIRFTRLQAIAAHSPSIAQTIRGARYEAVFSANGNGNGEGRTPPLRAEDLAHALEAFRRTDSVIVQRVKKDRTVEIDLKSFVTQIDLDRDRRAVTFEVALGGSGSVRPQEVLKHIFKFTDENFLAAHGWAVKRSALLAEKNGTYVSPFELSS